jgi:hypothetical protein
MTPRPYFFAGIGTMLAVLALSDCKLGPFKDDPPEVPTAPEPSWGERKALDAGVSPDAAAPVSEPAP